MNPTNPVNSTRLITPITNALTVDVEDFFQVHAFSDTIRRDEWDSFDSRVERNTYRILDILDSIRTSNNSKNAIQPTSLTDSINPGSSLKGTFFVLGWIAKRYPQLVKGIYDRGHEVACHGYAHQVIFNQTKNQFREDVRRAKGILEDLIGDPIVGYRAPTYSITKATYWALGILYELGFKYDSSIFPIKHDVYGYPEAPRFPFVVDLADTKVNAIHNRPLTAHEFNSCGSHAHSIAEFPMATVRIFRKNIPVAGGGYFRLFPYLLTKTFLKSINRKERNQFVFNIHPWEIDPELPRIDNAGMLSRFRTYINLDKTENRLRRLLSDFSFSSLSDILAICEAR